MLFDAFIPCPSDDSFLIDHQKRCTAPSTSHLKRHILRSTVRLQDVSPDFALVQAWNTLDAFSLPEDVLDRLNGSPDSRTMPMGYRFLRAASASSIEWDQ